MSTQSKVFSSTLSTLADGYSPEFGLTEGARLTIETSVIATGTPTGVWVLQRYGIAGWDTWDLGDASFADPSAGAAAGIVNVVDMPAGRFRVFYDRTSGGDASGATVIVRSSGPC